MKGIVRFAEYSVTGGLLWLNLFIFATLLTLPELSLDKAIEQWQVWLQAIAVQTPSTNNTALIESALSTLLAALAIILIFCTGLVLDLVSPLFCIPFQMMFFKNHLNQKQQRWFARLVHDNREFLLNDYHDFLQQPLVQLRNYKQWFEQRQRFLRLQAFIRNYLFVFSSNSQMEPFLDQLRIWNISRALFTSLLFLSILLSFLAMLSDLEHAADLAWLGIAIPLALTGLSYLSARAVFARLTTSMLAIAYHTYRLQQQPPSPPVIIERQVSNVEQPSPV